MFETAILEIFFLHQKISNKNNITRRNCFGLHQIVECCLFELFAEVGGRKFSYPDHIIMVYILREKLGTFVEQTELMKLIGGHKKPLNIARVYAGCPRVSPLFQENFLIVLIDEFLSKFRQKPTWSKVKKLLN